jgi:hypothetical protein
MEVPRTTFFLTVPSPASRRDFAGVSASPPLFSELIDILKISEKVSSQKSRPLYHTGTILGIRMIAVIISPVSFGALFIV